MHLTDRYGFPYEKRMGRPLHNFVRAIILLLRGQLFFKQGRYEPTPDLRSPTNEELRNRVNSLRDKMTDPLDFKTGEHTCHLDVAMVKTCKACVDEARMMSEQGSS